MREKLFICLAAFSQTGGIEKFNSCFSKALYDVSVEKSFRASMYSLYDSKASPSYFPGTLFKGFKGNKFFFILSSLWRARKCETIITGHINLAIIPWLIKKIYPSKKIIVVCHGLEVFEGIKGIKLKVLQQADLLLAVSQFTKASLQKLPGINNKLVIIFPNTIDPYFKEPDSFIKPILLKERYNISNGAPVLFTLTRLSSKEKYKGHDKVIACIKEVAGQFPDVIYLIGGKADKEEYEAAQQLIKENGLVDKVKMLGYIKEDELTDHFMLSDVFVMPSKKEGFGIVFLEAAVCGLTVIAGNKDGSRDALLNGELGILVDPDDINSIKEGILQAIKKSKTQDKYALQKKAMENFGYPKFKERLASVLTMYNN